MTVTFEDINNTRKKLIVEVPGALIAAQAAEATKSVASQVNLPGFRPGKAPVTMVQKRYGPAIAARMQENVLRKAYEHAIEDQQLKVYQLVDVEKVDLKADQDAEVVFTVDLQPQVPLPVYEGLSIEAPSAELTEEEFTRAKADFLQNRAEYQTVDDPAQIGDFLQFSYFGRLQNPELVDPSTGEPWIDEESSTWEAATAPDAEVELTQDFPRAYLARSLAGRTPGEEFSVELTIPESDDEEWLRGQTAVYKAKVSSIRRRVLPELDEAFLAGLGVASEADLDQRIRASIQQQKAQQVNSFIRNRLVNQLSENISFDIPETAIERERERILTRFLSEQMRQGADMDSIEERKEKLHDEATQVAVRQLRVEYLLLEIARKEELTISGEDLSPLIMQQATARRIAPDQVVREIRQDEAKLREMQREALLSKTIDLIVSRANITVAAGALHDGHDHDHSHCDHDHDHGEHDHGEHDHHEASDK